MAVTVVPHMQPPAVCHPQNPAPPRPLYGQHITLQEVPNGPELSPSGKTEDALCVCVCAGTSFLMYIFWIIIKLCLNNHHWLNTTIKIKWLSFLADTTNSFYFFNPSPSSWYFTPTFHCPISSWSLKSFHPTLYHIKISVWLWNVVFERGKTGCEQLIVE